MRECLGLPAKIRQGSPEHTAFEVLSPCPRASSDHGNDIYAGCKRRQAVFQRLDSDDSREITWQEFQLL